MTSNSRRRAELLRKSTSGQPLSFCDRIWLRWAMTDPKRIRIGGAWTWTVRMAFAGTLWLLICWLGGLLIGGWALLLAAIVMVALGARWLK